MFHLSRFASQGNPVFYTFLASPALFHPNLFGAYRHVGQECCDWFSEVGTLHRQPTKLGGSGGIGPHSEGIAYSGIMPCTSTSTATTHSTLSFVSSISVRGPFHSATHTEVERASGIMPQPLVLLSFVSSISVRRQISRDKLCARRGEPTKLWEHLTGSLGNMGPHSMKGEYEATQCEKGNMGPHRRAITRKHQHALAPCIVR